MEIIQAGPSARTLRQQAFQQGVNQIAQGAGSFLGAYQDQQDTERRRALQKLDLAQGFANQGIQLNDEDISAINQVVDTGEVGAGFKALLNRQAQASRQKNTLAQSPKPTRAQSAVDTTFGKEYADYVAGGGYASLQKNISQLEQVADKLGTTDRLTGPLLGMVPDAVKAFVAPESLGTQEDVANVTQQSLKQILGAQFTEKEAAALIKRAYNPSLSESENRKRLTATINQLKSMAQAKQDAVNYYEQYGTLSGFRGNLPNMGMAFNQQAPTQPPIAPQSSIPGAAVASPVPDVRQLTREQKIQMLKGAQPR